MNIKKALVGVLAVMTVMTFTAPSASAVTIDELQAQIQVLLAQLALLQGSQTTGGYTFTRNLTLGSTGADVKALQQFLNAKGFQVAATGAGSPGNETSYFGGLTKAALAKFQAANGISPAVGYFGPITRAKVNAMGGGIVPVGSGLKVELSGPAVGTIPSGSIYNPVLKIKFTAGEATTITGIKVVRGGFIANTNVTGVSVWDDMGVRYGNILSSLTADGEASFVFGTTPITIAAGQSKVITIAANLASGSYSGTISFSLMNASSVTVSGTTAVNGTFPIAGPAMSVVDGSTSLGNVYMDDRATVGVASATAQSATYDGNLEVGYTAREIYKFYLLQNNSKEAVKFEKIRLYLGGTIQEATDLKNFKLVAPDGTVLATAARAYDRYIDFVLATPYLVDKGLSKDFTIKADITDGSARYFYITILDDYDVVVRGLTTGAGILALDSAGAALTSSDVTNNSSGWFKIKAGAVTISKASSSPSGNIAPGSQNAVLARFEFKAGGEGLEVRRLGVQVNYAGIALSGTLMVRDAATGATYLSVAVDTHNVTTTAVTAGTLSTYQQNLANYITLAAGETKVLDVVGTVSQTATSTSNYTAYMGQAYVKRLSSNDYQTLAASATAGNTLTVRSVTVDVTKDASFANTNRSPGTSNQKIGQFVLRPSSADDVRVTTISFAITTSTNFQNVKLMDGAVQLGSTIGTPAATGNSFTLSNYTLTKDTPKTLAVYADVLPTAASSSVVSVEASGVNGVGVNSSVSLTLTPAADVALQTITIAGASVTIAADGAMPTSKIVLAGQTGLDLHKIKFEARNEALTLKKITLGIVSASTTAWTTSTLAANYGTVYLYDGGTLLGSGSFNSVNGTVPITGLNVTLPQDTEKVLTVKSDITASGTLVPASVAAINLFSTSSDYLEIYSGSGILADSSISVTLAAKSNYMLYHDAAPAVANAMSSGIKTPSTNQEVSKFTITNTAPAGGRTLTLNRIQIYVSMSGASTTATGVTDFKLYDESGAEIASSTASATSTVTLTFASTSANWVSQTIAAGTSKTYTMKANTTAIRTGVSSGQNVYFSTKVDGAKGYLSSDANAQGTEADEAYWNDGALIYQYTQAGTLTLYTGNQASDSYPIDGATLTY